jgi:drug/metabolite transporter (DMT)-like permease
VARIATASACLGLAAILAKRSFEGGVPPLRLASIRVVIALVVLVAVLAVWRRALLRPPTGAWPLLAVFGISVAAVNATYFLAIDRVPVGVAISLQYTAPVMLLAWAALVTRRPPARPAWVAGGLTLAGSVLVSRALEDGAGFDPGGVAAALGSAVTLCSALLAAEALGRRGVHAATVLVYGFGIAVLLWSVVTPWWSFPWRALADPGVTLAVVGVGLLGTLVPFFLQVGAVMVLPAALAGIAMTSEPVFASAFAWALLGERLTPVQLAGGALTVAGVALAQASQQPAPTSETTARTAGG